MGVGPNQSIKRGQIKLTEPCPKIMPRSWLPFGGATRKQRPTPCGPILGVVQTGYSSHLPRGERKEAIVKNRGIEAIVAQAALVAEALRLMVRIRKLSHSLSLNA
jgi:hypothetical protein